MNQPITPELFNQLWQEAKAYQQDKEFLTTYCHVGADPDHYLPIIAHTEFAWHALFAKTYLFNQIHSTLNKK